MRKLNLVTTMLVVLVLTGAGFPQGSSSAQVNQQHQTTSGQTRHQEMMTPEAMVEHLSTELNLTKDQRAKIKPMAESVYKKMNEARQDNSLSEQARSEKIRQIHENALGHVKTILSRDQQRKLDEMMSGHANGETVHSHGGQGQGATPHELQ